jgi:hypothetical protein
MKFTPRGEFPRQRPLLASPLVLLSGEELIITEFPRQRPLLASPLVLLSGEQLGFCDRGRYLLPTPGVIFDACGWAWTFRSSPRATRSVVESSDTAPLLPWPRSRLTRHTYRLSNIAHRRPRLSINHGCTDGTGPRPSFEPK